MRSKKKHHLVGLHVFASETRIKTGTGGWFSRCSNIDPKYESMILRCKIIEVRGKDIAIHAEGNNNPVYDGKGKWVTTGCLICMPTTGESRIEEKHGRDGMNADLGVWSDLVPAGSRPLDSEPTEETEDAKAK